MMAIFVDVVQMTQDQDVDQDGVQVDDEDGDQNGD